MDYSTFNNSLTHVDNVSINLENKNILNFPQGLLIICKNVSYFTSINLLAACCRISFVLEKQKRTTLLFCGC